MIKDILIYLAVGMMIGVVVAMFCVSGPDVASIMSTDYTKALKQVGWLVK